MSHANARSASRDAEADRSSDTRRAPSPMWRVEMGISRVRVEGISWWRCHGDAGLREVVRQLAPNRALRSPYRADVLFTRNFGSVAHRVVVVPVRAM
jgi:hypothetical protein